MARNALNSFVNFDSEKIQFEVFLILNYSNLK